MTVILSRTYIHTHTYTDRDKKHSRFTKKKTNNLWILDNKEKKYSSHNGYKNLSEFRCFFLFTLFWTKEHDSTMSENLTKITIIDLLQNDLIVEKIFHHIHVQRLFSIRFVSQKFYNVIISYLNRQINIVQIDLLTTVFLQIHFGLPTTIMFIFIIIIILSSLNLYL